MTRLARRLAALLARSAAALVLMGVPSAAAGTGASDKAPDAQSEDVSHVDLAAKMIADGHYDRAEALLSGVDADQEGVDRKKLFTLLGVVYLHKQLLSASVDAFESAIAAGQTEPAVQLYLAKGYFGLGRHEATLTALDAAGSAATAAPESFLMRAQSHWELGQPASSIAALDSGLKQYPTASEMLRLKIFLLVEVGLYQTAAALSQAYLARDTVTEDDYVAIGEALRAGRQYSEAQLLLERAHLQFPSSEKVAVQLAHSYLQQEHPVAAAMLFEDLARTYPKYYLESAELYKQARRIERALNINARIIDQKDKLKQRLSLLLSREEFEQIAGMARVLSRHDLLKDDDIRYALAFALFNTAQFDQAEQHLALITKRELFEAAVELRRAITTCRGAGWECRQ